MGSLIRKIPGKEGVKLFEDSEFCLGLDLGQSSDPSAVSVLERIQKYEVTYKGKEHFVGEELRCRYLARLPLGLSYIAQVDRVAQLLKRPPLDQGCQFVVDETGVGRPVADLFERVGLYPVRIAITSGERATAAGTRSFHVPKSVLISTLDARLHSNELKFSAELSEAGAMAEELKDFRRSVSAAGRSSFEARVGKSDDLVLSVALSCWWLSRPKAKPCKVGKYFSSRRR